MITIDGSFGEGGGQILRTSLGLALVTGKPFRIQKIRAVRKQPGLLRQHLTAVNAASRIGCAEVTGASIGSTDLTFAPQTILAGHYSFAVGTAGSATLVLQTVLPALLLADAPSTLTLEGGTHNPFAPPYDFVARTFLPLINRMGVEVTARLERPGFYPAGGGKFEVAITPAANGLRRLDLLDRGDIRGRLARALVANLPISIAERELAVVAGNLSWKEAWLKPETVDNSRGPGNIVMIEIESDQVTEIFTGFGQRGLRAEAVAEQAVKEARQYLKTGAFAGEHLADQLVVPLAVAGGGSFTAVRLSRHMTTNVEIVGKFIDIDIQTTMLPDRTWKVEVKTGSSPP
jgi:RNA 3'-terminal phosphate cyclase (ATP)